MNQAQQSAKWNPRDSMNFRERRASTEGQKPLRDIKQQTEHSLCRSRGEGDGKLLLCKQTEIGPAIAARGCSTAPGGWMDVVHQPPSSWGRGLLDGG